jgi:synaptic vesicle membrane protein VAT-1
MRQVWITKAGPPEVLQVREAPDPTPRAGEVRIRVEASGINFADLMVRMGLYPDAPKLLEASSKQYTFPTLRKRTSSQ